MRYLINFKTVKRKISLVLRYSLEVLKCSDQIYMKKHIKGAVCINAEDLENAIENYMYGRTGIVRTGDVLLKKNKIILLYCSRGAQSYFMCRKMSMAGFNVKSLAGGIERYKGRYITA